jgi:mitogen-activated protein kinase kinase kinase 19
VWLGLTNTGELIAVKQMQLRSSSVDFADAERQYDKIYQEVTILKTLMHQNIVG